MPRTCRVHSRLARRQTLASFDYQWRHLPAGDAMLSEPWFAEHADAILADELLAVDRAWFRGRNALDAGCGGGRWTLALLRLGCRVTAVDASAAALAATREQVARLVPEALAEGRLHTEQVDLLALPEPLARARFDLVFSFGVLHHTGDTRRALAALAPLVAEDGLLFLYLYGRGSARGARSVLLRAARLALAPLPFALKTAVLRRLLPRRDPHQLFDLLSPVVNDVEDHATVEQWLRDLGFPDVARTAEHTEIFVRAARLSCSARPFRPTPAPPYWFERYRRDR
jgi:SAM-dependent methyltransferase